jgi:hypothetical protein
MSIINCLLSQISKNQAITGTEKRHETPACTRSIWRTAARHRHMERVQPAVPLRLILNAANPYPFIGAPI